MGLPMDRLILANDMRYNAEIQQQHQQLSHGLTRYHSIELSNGHILPGFKASTI